MVYQMFVIPSYQSFYRGTAYQKFVIPGRLYLQWWVYKIGGLQKNDFMMAAGVMKFLVSKS
jgi:hypothetical protein